MENIKYLASFLVLVLLINSLAGQNALHSFLILVVLGVVYYNWNKYSITITTPQIYQREDK